MKKALVVVALLAAIGVLLVGGTSTATAGSTATITFELSSDGHGCLLTITSSKDISNFTVNGVKTELRDGTTTLVLIVQPGDVITVKAGTTIATFTVPTDTVCGVPDHGHDGHVGHHH